MKSENRISIFVLWKTNSKELEQLAKILRRNDNVNFTIRTEQGINVNIMMECDKE